METITLEIVGRRLTRAGVTVLATLLVSVGAASAAGRAQATLTASDQMPWLAWVGCWHLVEEQLGEGAPADTPAVTMVCLSPHRELDRLDVTTVSGGDAFLALSLATDGSRQTIETADCRSERTDRWSGDGMRIYSQAETSCADEPVRLVSGMSLLTSSSRWVDIELAQVAGREELTVRRYRRSSRRPSELTGAPPLAADLEAAAAAAARRVGDPELSIPEIIDATTRVAPKVVEVALMETRTRVELDSRTLIELDAASVPESVIDLMVALAYPDRFVVDRPERIGVRSSTGGMSFGGASYDYFTGWSPYYASPFGSYYSWSPLASLYYLGPATYYVGPVRRPGGLAGGPAVDSVESGRAVQGRGYTRVRPREVSTVVGSSTGSSSRGSGGRARDGGGSATTSGSAASSGTASRGGYSGGRGGRSTGRTARPRTP